MDLQEVLSEYRTQTGPYGKVPTVQQVNGALVFARNAKVVTKKIGVSKKGSGELFHRGVWGYPKVFVESGLVRVQAKNKFFATPFLVSYEFVDIGAPSKVQKFEVDMNRPAVPQLLCEKPFELTHHQYCSESLGTWLAENCHEICDLDSQIQDAWNKQEEEFLPEAERYVAKFGEKQRELFRAKLAKEFARHRNSLADMDPSHVFELFQLAARRADALNSLISFCSRNRFDSAFVDESDIKAALDIAKVKDLMDS